MSNITKKIIASIVTVTCAVWMIGPGIGVAQATISDECREDIQTCTQTELIELLTELTDKVNQLSDMLDSLGDTTPTTPTTPTVTGCTITSFDRYLKQGMTGDDIKCLQVILNSDSETQLADGVGSPGNETSYFGSKTKAAVIKFQTKYAPDILAVYGLTTGTGYVGRTTTAKLNTMLVADPDPGDPTDPPVTPGTEAVGLAPTTPAANAVAQGSANVEFTQINFSAGAQAYTVNSIIVTRSGISVNTDVTSLKLYDGTAQVGSTQALNSATSKATFTNLNWIIPANTVKTLTIKGTIGTNAGDSVVLGIASASDITATVVPSGTFPINGNAKTIAGSASAVGTFTVASSSVPAAGDILSGSVEQQVAKFSFNAVTEGFSLNSFKLTQVGTAGNSDIFNVTIKYGATILATVASLQGSSVTFTGNPLISIPVGTTKNIDVFVDVAEGINTGRTIIMEITQAADVVAVGSNSGGQVTAAGSYPLDGRTQTIGQGTLTVAPDSAVNPPAQSYVIGSTNRTFTAIKLSTGATEGARLTQLSLTLAGTMTVTDISNISLYDGTTLLATGVLTGTTVQFGQNTVNSFDTPGLVDIPAGTNKTLLVKVDISSGAAANATGSLSIAAATQVKADGLLSLMDIPVASITGTAAGSIMTISAMGTLAISLDSSSLGAQIVPKGTESKAIASFALNAGTGEDILVSAITISLYKDGATTTTSTVVGDLTNVSIWDGSMQLGTAVSAPVASAAFNTNLIVPAGTKKIITVQLTVPTGSSADSFHADFATSSAITTGVSSNATVPPTGGAVGNLMTVGTPTLSVTTSPLPVAAYWVTNAREVVMTTLLLTAGTAEDVNVSQIRLSFDASNTLAAASDADTRLASVMLMDGSTVIAGPLAITEGTPDYLLATGLTNLKVLAGSTKAISVVVDITGLTGTFYSGILATGAIRGTGAVSGTAVSTTDTVKSGAGLTIAGTGTLTVKTDAATPNASNIAVGVTLGAQGISFTSINLAAALENVKISRIMLTSTGGRDSNFGAVYLYDGSTLLGTSYMNATTATFSFSAGNEIIVPANGYKVITVKAYLMGIGAGSTHADAPKFYIADVPTDITSIGVDSQIAIVEATTTPLIDDAANVNAQNLYKTTASVGGNTLASGAFNPSTKTKVLSFPVTNNGLYDLTLNTLTFTPSISGTVGTSTDGTVKMEAYWSDDLATLIASATTSSTTVPVLQNATAVTLSTTTNLIIGAGQTKTMVVYAYTTGLSTTGNSIQMNISATADFGWIPVGGTEVTTLTPGLPLTGPSFTKS